MKILTVVGARPQFIKAAMVSQAIVKHNKGNSTFEIVEEIIHTGQHYDDNMSAIFFDQMGIPKPAVRLDCGGGSHGEMTGQMLAEIEKEIIDRQPDWVLVYGDTNSTLAGALAAAKLHVPVAHVEAGLRSFNKKMPEEINRIVTDHMSTQLFCPTASAIENLKNEGITQGVHSVGDVMYDAALFFGELAQQQSSILESLNLTQSSFYLATVHRQENTDDLVRLKNIIKGFDEIASSECPLVLPLHPRTKKAMNVQDLTFTNPHVRLVPPLPFIDMVMLEKNAKIILTDSGGVQKEAYFHQVPCITLRDETEWVETVNAGWNILVRGEDLSREMLDGRCLNHRDHINEYGDGSSASKIMQLVLGDS